MREGLLGASCDAVVIELRASTHERSNERSSIDGRSLDPEEASASGVDGVAAMAGPPPTTEPVLVICSGEW